MTAKVRPTFASRARRGDDTRQLRCTHTQRIHLPANQPRPPRLRRRQQAAMRRSKILPHRGRRLPSASRQKTHERLPVSSCGDSRPARLRTAAWRQRSRQQRAAGSSQLIRAARATDNTPVTRRVRRRYPWDRPGLAQRAQGAGVDDNILKPSMIEVAHPQERCAADAARDKLQHLEEWTNWKICIVMD